LAHLHLQVSCLEHAVQQLAGFLVLPLNKVSNLLGLQLAMEHECVEHTHAQQTKPAAHSDTGEQSYFVTGTVSLLVQSD
jgi:hypothetical protein